MKLGSLSIAVSIIAACLAGMSAKPAFASDQAGELAEVPSAGTLETTGATIGHIRIVNNDVFDLDDPAEDGYLYRLANALHQKTRQGVIENQLLFAPGDEFSRRSLQETERLLRRNRYLHDAEILPTDVKDGSVSIDVRTTDVWSLAPGISLGRSGGRNTSGVGLKEHNLFGTGSRVEVSHKSGVDRSSTEFSFGNRMLFGTHLGLLAEVSQNSDGQFRHFDIGKPFYALDSRRAWSLNLLSSEQEDRWYDRGEISATYRHSFARYRSSVGWSAGLQDGWVRRYRTGLAYDEDLFAPIDNLVSPNSSLPADRGYLYPFASVEIIEDQFTEDSNLDQIGRVEDRHLGTRWYFRLGFAPGGGSSRQRAALFDSEYRNALYHSDASSLVVDAALGGRYRDGQAENLRLQLGARFDHRWSDNQLLHARISATAMHNPDFDKPLYLGGDNGLRGYPLRYQGGASSLLMTLEQRVFTDWYPWHLFHVGAAVFFDAGRTWGQAPRYGRNIGWLRNIGAGLRIGNSRSSVGRMLHVDLAYPLDGEQGISDLQLLVEAKKGF